MAAPREPDKKPRRPLDSEIQAMASITRAMAGLDGPTQERVAGWVIERYGRNPYPNKNPEPQGNNV